MIMWSGVVAGESEGSGFALLLSVCAVGKDECFVR